MGAEPDRVGDPRQRLAAHEVGQAPGQVPLGLGLEPPPQKIRDDQTKDPVAEKFEPLVAALRRSSAAPAPLALGGQRARMGQRFGKQFGPGEA